jgi:hypothetical protein
VVFTFSLDIWSSILTHIPMRPFAFPRVLFRSPNHVTRTLSSFRGSTPCSTNPRLEPALSSDFGKIGMLAYEATRFDDTFWEFCLPGLGRHSTVNLDNGMTIAILQWQREWRDDRDTHRWWKVVDGADTIIRYSSISILRTVRGQPIQCPAFKVPQKRPTSGRTVGPRRALVA